MPLTNVVDDFNTRLLALQPHAPLGHGASHDQRELLVLDVQRRHLAALPEHQP